MAYTTSTKYKNKIYDENSSQYLDFYIGNEKINRDYVKSMKYDDSIFEGDSFSLGSTIISSFEIVLSNEIFDDFETIDEFKVNFTLELDDGEEIIPFGNYIVKEKDSSSGDYTKFKLYDYMSKFDALFDASSLVPCTRYELLKAICDEFNVELANESILNGDIIVNSYDNSFSAKTYISLIAERAGSFAKITRDNKLILKRFDEVDEYDLPEDIAGDYTTNDLKTITGVRYQNAVSDYEYGNETGEVVQLSQDSLFTCTEEEVQNIYNVLNGISYQTLEIKLWGDPAIDTGDIIKLGNIKTFAQMSWEFGNGFYGTYKTILNEANSSLPVQKLSSKKQMKRLQAVLDEVNGKIILLSQDVEGYDSKIAEIELATAGINTTVSNIIDLTDQANNNIENLSKLVDQKTKELNDLYNNLNNTVDVNYAELLKELATKADNVDLSNLEIKYSEEIKNTYKKEEIQQIINGMGYCLTDDLTFQKDKKYYIKDNNNYVIYTNYQVGDNIPLDDNDKNVTIYEYVSVTSIVSTESKFDKDGMRYSKSNKDTSTIINYKGLEVDNSNQEELLFAGIDEDENSKTKGDSIVRTNNLKVSTYCEVGVHGRFEEYENGVGFFII